MALQLSMRRVMRQGCRALSPIFGSPPSGSDSLEQFSMPSLSCHIPTAQDLVTRMQFSTAVVSAEYKKRNYAENAQQYTDMLYNLSQVNRSFLLRDVYEDMLLDGIQPLSDTFYPLLVGCMKGARLQDAFFFYEEMKSMGLIPDDSSFNCLIATCGRCRQQRRAFQVVEEMMQFNMRPNQKTLTALLGACGAAGLPKEAAGVVQRITESGFSLNKYCYAALIAAEKNQLAKKSDTLDKIIELVRQSSSWSAQEAFGGRDARDIVDEIDEYLYCLPTVDFVRGRRNMVDRRLTVYHAALCACADLKSTSALRTVLEMLKQEGYQADMFCVAQIIRCHLACREYGIALRALNGYLNSGRPARAELFFVCIVEAMKGYTEEGMDTAKQILQDMLSKNFPLTNKMHADLLDLASQEMRGDFSMANLLFDLMEKRNITLPLKVIDSYWRGLKRREIPEGDPRLSRVQSILNRRGQAGSGTQQRRLQA